MGLTLKSLLPVGVSFWELESKVDFTIAKIRGFYYKQMGYINSNDSAGSPLLGPTYRSFFEDNAEIVLNSRFAEGPEKCPADFNKSIYSMGLLNPRRFQNPIAYESRFRLCEKSKLQLAPHTRIGQGFYISIASRLCVEIGSWTYIGNCLQIHCREGISIGARCMFSHNVTLMDYDGHPLLKKSDSDHSGNTNLINHGKSGQIKIDDDVWVGANVTILKGVQIGSGSVVASGSIVTKDVPPHCLVGGNPAKIITQDIKWKPF